MIRPVLIISIAALLTACSNPGNTCYERFKAKLKDPESSTLTEWLEDQGDVLIDVRAANSMGGFGHVYARCKADHSIVTYDDKNRWRAGL